MSGGICNVVTLEMNLHQTQYVLPLKSLVVVTFKHWKSKCSQLAGYDVTGCNASAKVIVLVSGVGPTFSLLRVSHS